jgi:hypothetical protein
MNWKNLIEDLVNDGMTQAQIADACDTSQSNIWYLLNTPGRSPSWSLGQLLVNLHDDRYGGGAKRK